MSTKLYVKALALDGNRNLVPCFGGDMVWEFSNPRSDAPEGTPRTVYVDAPEMTVEVGKPCEKGSLHALRIQDLPHWLGVAYAVVEMRDAKVHDSKVCANNSRIVRVADFDTLEMLCAFADYCANKGADYTDAEGAKFLAAQFPAGFLDGVEE